MPPRTTRDNEWHDSIHQGPRAADELVLVALGGLGEIGMNAYLYGLGPPDARQWLMVDLGLTFPHENEPGVDVVLPDLRFIEGEKGALAGLLLTHAHEDHIGAVLDLWPRLKCPIYATPFTAGMLQAKVVGERQPRQAADQHRQARQPVQGRPVRSRAGDAGAFDPGAVGRRDPHRRTGTVFHTGDWKLDATPLVGDPSNDAGCSSSAQEGVDVVVCDSTNAMREGRSPSEIEVAASIAKIIKGAKRRVAVTTFASNVARVRAVADAATAAAAASSSCPGGRCTA